MTPNPLSTCPACGSGELRPGPLLVRCSGCDYALSRDLFLALRRIRALPEAERLACRCGQPETRRLPSGEQRCPACGEKGARQEASTVRKKLEEGGGP